MEKPLPTPVIHVSAEATQVFGRLLKAVRHLAIQKTPFPSFQDFSEHIDTLHRLIDTFHDAVLEATTTGGAPEFDQFTALFDSPEHTAVRRYSSSSDAPSDDASSPSSSASSSSYASSSSSSSSDETEDDDTETVPSRRRKSPGKKSKLKLPKKKKKKKKQQQQQQQQQQQREEEEEEDEEDEDASAPSFPASPEPSVTLTSRTATSDVPPPEFTDSDTEEEGEDEEEEEEEEDNDAPDDNQAITMFKRSVQDFADRMGSLDTPADPAEICTAKERPYSVSVPSATREEITGALRNKQYTVYHVRVGWGEDFRKSIAKRYKEFTALDRSWRESFPELGKLLQDYYLEPRSLIHKYSPELVEKRRGVLDRYLNQIVRYDVLTPLLAKFLEVPVDFLAAEGEDDDAEEGWSRVRGRPSLHHPGVRCNAPNQRRAEEIDRQLTRHAKAGYTLRKIADTHYKHFDYMSILGSGAFGVVCRVRHRKTGKHFAMKIIDVRRADRLFGNRLQSSRKTAAAAGKGGSHHARSFSVRGDSEVGLLGGLDHPFVIRLEMKLRGKRRQYLVMELVDGPTLHQVLRKTPVLPLETVRRYAAEILLAIHYIHAMGIVHRDLRAPNILISPKNHIKLSDFGVSLKLTEEHTASKRLIGAQGYKAPEMLSGQKYTFSIDYWNFGLIFYTMACGRHPFQGSGLFNKGRDKNALHKEVTYPAGLDLDAQDLIQRLLQKDPGKRLGCGDDLSESYPEDVMSHDFFATVDWTQTLLNGARERFSKDGFPADEEPEFESIKEVLRASDYLGLL